MGTYPITIQGAEAKNYELTLNEGRLTVEKAELTVRADNQRRIYGDENPEFSLSFSGLKNNEKVPDWEQKPVIETTADISSEVGQYPITISNAAAFNYNLTLESGTLSVERAPLKVTPKDATRKYGEENPQFELSFFGLKNDEQEPAWVSAPIVTTSASAVSPVGDYEIKVASAETKNYTVERRTGTLTITKAPLDVCVKNYSRQYGKSNPTFEMSYNGLVNGENAPEWLSRPTIVTDATPKSDVGEYTITASDGVMRNYENNGIEPGILSVTPAPLTISASDATILYFSTIPSLTYRYQGFMGDDDEEVLTKKPVIQTAATMTSPVGTYPIEVTGAEAANYDINYENGTLNIKKRRLTVSTKNYTRIYGDENPEFELLYSGFVNDEDESVLLTKPQAATTATKRSDTGDYPITIADGSALNYDLAYIPGVLTIEKAYQSLEWNQDFSTVDQYAQIELTATSSSGLEITYSVEGDNICTIEKIGNTCYLYCFGAGEAVVVAQQEGNNNYWQTTKMHKPIKIIPTAVQDLKNIPNGIEAVYDAAGRKLSKLQHGVNVVLQSDGTKKKVVVK